MIAMTVCNCPPRCRSTTDFAPCSCCASGEHRDPKCPFNLRSIRDLPSRIVELGLVRPDPIPRRRTDPWPNKRRRARA